ncbi:putative long-chain-fatty-acid-CoA ligase [Trypanosoma rangeli]|uniref:Putative long-chain-fatty-acid-CoA ligase n=1 Tax=Trypanosoma rangeli TaxID=5698 RepID=A0A3R7KRF3_TRYRA|nr:putative long-chain-fatty-acid-CoA ligase [Trypanosoma rangeli]RNE99860.1 putative long-chain-fatty-acid-CoA ligase [Trypanosoma rangeli]|eukprot:RNE99860.1 putative long-chain-fatty-acid-CoA ligase [Trypanosoma rangeli]
MFRISRWRLDKVPFATLFGYNSILQSVFSAPVKEEAIVVELPGGRTERYTYGQLQKDVLSMSNVITERREAMTVARGKPSLSWLQQPRPSNVRSVFADGDGGVLSCDFMKDDGQHNVAIIGTTGYTFVVSLLAAWSLNQMAVPIPASQNCTAELLYILEHSKSRAVMGDTVPLKENLPRQYDALLVRSFSSLHNPMAAAFSTTSSSAPSTYDVETLFDVQKLLEKIQEKREISEAATTVILPDHLLSEEERHHLKDAHDIMSQISDEKAVSEECREALRQYMIREHFKAHCAVTDAEDGTGLFYDTDHLDSLNVVHRLWAEEYATRPSKHDDCVMIYTSGTTARPKGAVHTHASLQNMVRVLRKAWEWSSKDTILHTLPVYHIHGLVNILLCSLASNARCILTKFDDPLRIVRRLERGDITLMMGVPTMYTKLIAAVNQKMSPIEQAGFKNAVSQNVRLMVSGSAPLPVPIIHAFREISGHTLLERYGMTEIGMALSHPLRPMEKRIPGTVGSPLPTVRAFVHSASAATGEESGTAGGERVQGNYDEIGQLAIASKSLFDRYWRNPEETKKVLVVSQEGRRYFETGDTVGVSKPRNEEEGAIFTILGRSSMDILKCRGFKLSALEIEAALLSRQDIFFEIAVVGCKDDMLGEEVVAIITPQPAALQKWNIPPDFDRFESPELNAELKAVARSFLSYYKCPSRFILLPEIPRNPTGKVNKKNLKEKLSLA